MKSDRNIVRKNKSVFMFGIHMYSNTIQIKYNMKCPNMAYSYAKIGNFSHYFVAAIANNSNDLSVSKSAVCLVLPTTFLLHYK